MLADELDYVLGVDTAWAIEGTGSYGAGLARYLSARGEVVLEVSRTPRAERRLRGKDDALDAARKARAALARDKLARPRAGERREALRLLLVARRSAVDVRREALTQLPRGDRHRARSAPPKASRTAAR
jgi:transposase